MMLSVPLSPTLEDMTQDHRFIQLVVGTNHSGLYVT